MPKPERPPAPARDHLGWWLIIHCRCGYRVDLPIRLLVERHGANTDLHLIGTRLRCQRCSQRPMTVNMTDRPDRTGQGYGGGTPATIKPLPGVVEEAG